MTNFGYLLLLLISPVALGAVVNPTPKLLYEIDTEVFPAFCNMIVNSVLTGDPSNPVYDLVYSSFSANPRQLDPIMRIEGVSKKYLDSTQMISSSITDEIVWPNEVAAVPSEIFSLPEVWSVAGGFFLTGKNDGELALMTMTDLIGGQTNPITISSNPTGTLWYYHRVEWYDMNNDGYKDAITARANGGGPAADITQLVWFENPGGYQPTPNWDVHVLTENVEDVYFRLIELPLNGDTVTAIVSSGFYSNLLNIVYSDKNDFTDLASIQTVIIDNYGWYFDVEMVDVNQDGKLDLLTTTWSQSGKPGAVLAYEVPDGDWTTATWPKHIIQDGYKSFLIAGSGSPGSANIFWPSRDMEEDRKPYIMVSGDDDGNAYVLTANSEDSSDWSYTQTTIYKDNGTIGGIGIADVDGDGYTEIFIPAYTVKKIAVMSYKF
ncbi:uncharacterized protein LOC143455832 isoform X2 [Clavelina lepadiformis]|uniref:uncharacterized protein LOC143455832 isoform X2 n=1 Tax=Clavelina lepadiformis TaxID=159417 RepID=UPI00404385C6